MKYFAFCDPSGGSSDSMTLAVARASLVGKKAVLVAAVERRAPFDPDACVEEFSEILRSYRLTTVVGDRYSAQWVVERFRSHGITYQPSEKTKSEIFLTFLALTNADRVRIPNNRRLRAQLVGLERRTSRSGRDFVDHAAGGHDDLCNAVAGSLVLAAAAPLRRPFWPFVLDVRVGQPPPPPEPGTWHDPRAGKDAYDPFTEFPGERWSKF